jgi:hypothetical protein
MRVLMTCPLLLSWTALAFQPATISHVSTRLIPLSVSTLEEADQVIDVEFEPVVAESARLSKAKKLLEQFTTERDDSINKNGKILLLPASGSNNFTSRMITVDDNMDNVVPDDFWSNGHLQGGDYVTRWARGVKVAEPLVRYDPVVAEQVLFKQPTKWLVRNAQIAFPLGFWAVGVVADYLLGRSKENRRQRARQLLDAITYLGPVR